MSHFFLHLADRVTVKCIATSPFLAFLHYSVRLKEKGRLKSPSKAVERLSITLTLFFYAIILVKPYYTVRSHNSDNINTMYP